MRGWAKRVILSRDDDGEAVAKLHLGGLPSELVVRVAELLPVACIAKLRALSKAWRSAMSSPSFLRTLKPREEWWLVMATPSIANPFAQELVAFSECVGPWEGFPLPLPSSSVLSDLLVRVAVSQSLVPSVANMLLASAGGLVCAVIEGAMPHATSSSSSSSSSSRSPDGAPALALAKPTYDLAVFNILTDSLVLLPRPSRLSNRLVSSCFIAMSADPDSDSDSDPITYRVILSNPKYRDLEIYDSSLATWRKGLGIHLAPDLHPASPPEYPGIFPRLLAGDLLRYHRERLASYHSASDTWCTVDVPSPRPPAPLELLKPTVLKCKGRLLLVACLLEAALAIKGFGVWDLQFLVGPRPCFQWVELARTPPTSIAPFRTVRFDGPSFYDCRFISHDHCICMSGAHYTVGTPCPTEYWPPLIYHVSLDTWHHLPSYRNCKDFFCAFTLVPNFNAAT